MQFARRLGLALCVALSAAPAFAQSQLGLIEEGERFPEIKFPALDDGQPTTLAQYRGKPVLLLVFASW